MGNKKFGKASKGSNRSGSQSSKRERNRAHTNASEHSVKPKGNRMNPAGTKKR